MDREPKPSKLVTTRGFAAIFLAVTALLTASCGTSEPGATAPSDAADAAVVSPSADADESSAAEPDATTAPAVSAAPAPTVAQEPAVEPTSSPEAESAAPLARRIVLPADISGLEGIAVDPTSGRVFVGDLNEGTVWVGAAAADAPDAAAFEPFAVAPERSGAAGLAVDPDARRLYVATFLLGDLDIHDLDTGEFIERVELQVEDGSIINDVTVASDGTVYVTDSGIGRIHHYDPDLGTAEVFFDVATDDLIPGTVSQLQFNGIVVDDEVVLAVHMQSGNLYRFDRTSGDAEAVVLDGAETPGRDGLLLCGDRLYGVLIDAFSGGVGGVRVIDLSADRRAGSFVEDLVDESFSSPATVAAFGGELLVTNAQFSAAAPTSPYWLTALPFDSADC